MMSMLNQAAVEALCSATYLENYLDCMDNLPDDLQRVVSQLRELDSVTNDIMTEIAHHQEIYLNNEGDASKKQRALLQIQRGLIKSQEMGDEKLSLVGLIIEHIENRTRQLEQDLENLDPSLADAREERQEKKSDMKQTKPTPSMLPSPPIPNIPAQIPIAPVVSIPATSSPSLPTTAKTTATAVAAVVTVPSTAPETPVTSTSATTMEMSIKSDAAGNKARRQRRQRMAEANTKEEEKQKEEEEKMQPKKKKKRKAKKAGDKSFEKTLVGEPIDPDEPTYCLCEQVSYGDMIGCDNDGCAIEWFHFNCVGLSNKPKGKWFCPKCRGDKASVKRADLK